MMTNYTDNQFIRLRNDCLELEISPKLDRMSLRHCAGSTFSGNDPFRIIYGNAFAGLLPEHCRYQTEILEDRIKIRFDSMVFWSRFKGHGYIRPEPGPNLIFNFELILEDDHLIFAVDPVENMDEEELQIICAAGLTTFDCRKEGRLLLPYGFGVQFSFPRSGNFQAEYQPGWGYSLPIYTLSQGKGTLMVYNKTPFDLITRMEFNNREAGRGSIETGFNFDRKLANYRREMHLYPLPAEADFNVIAKRYRSIVMDERRFKSLAEKIAESPDVEKLRGTVLWKHNVYCKEPPPDVKHSYSLYMQNPNFNAIEQYPSNWTFREVFDTAHERGFDRVCVYNTGWNRHGFDKSYPTRFPVNSERGTEEDFTAGAEYARSLSPGYIFSVHDNYSDAYTDCDEDYENDLARDADQVIRKGGIWRGGRARLFCTRQSMKYAKRDIPRIRQMLGCGSIYLDVLGNHKLLSCSHPEHPMGQREDVAARRELLQYARTEMGSVGTEGIPHDCYADVVDLAAFGPLHYLDATVGCDPLPVPVPLWQLIYHDSLLNYTAEGAYRFDGTEYKLYVALWGFLPTQFDDFSKRISFELRDTFGEEMVAYEILDELKVIRQENGEFATRGAARSRFANGTEVIANFNERTFTCNGVTIPPRDFLIHKTDQIEVPFRYDLRMSASTANKGHK